MQPYRVLHHVALFVAGVPPHRTRRLREPSTPQFYSPEASKAHHLTHHSTAFVRRSSHTLTHPKALDNQAENREEDGVRRGSVDQVSTPAGTVAATTATVAAAPAAARAPELSDEDGDDFEDDFEDP